MIQTLLTLIGAIVVLIVAASFAAYGLAKLDDWLVYRRQRARAIARLTQSANMTDREAAEYLAANGPTGIGSVALDSGHSVAWSIHERFSEPNPTLMMRNEPPTAWASVPVPAEGQSDPEAILVALGVLRCAIADRLASEDMP